MGEPASVWNPNRLLLGKLKKKVMMSQTLARKRQFLLSKIKRTRGRSKLPLRLTSCVFKSPVTKITAHPGNVVRRRRQEKPSEKLQQISAYRRLQELQTCGSKGELLSTLDIIDNVEKVAPGSAAGCLGRAGLGTLHTSPEPIAAQFLNWEEVIPGGGLCIPQLLCRQTVSRGNIRKQTRKVKKARERLAEALREDSLAREAERARSQE